MRVEEGLGTQALTAIAEQHANRTRLLIQLYIAERLRLGNHPLITGKPSRLVKSFELAQFEEFLQLIQLVEMERPVIIAYEHLNEKEGV